MFKILEKKFNITPPWGILTGIRPVKIVHSLLMIILVMKK